MSGQSQQLIQKLLKAEEEAEGIISKARENRVKKLRDAKNAADDEIAAYRSKEEEKFKSEINVNNEDEISNNLETQTTINLKKVGDDFSSNRGKILEYMVRDDEFDDCMHPFLDHQDPHCETRNQPNSNCAAPKWEYLSISTSRDTHQYMR